jgi:uncharacterized protein (DUF952 family)
VLLLTLDPQRLAAAGLALRWEPAPGSGELFPHLYGALPVEAVLLAEPFPYRMADKTCIERTTKPALGGACSLSPICRQHGEPVSP